MEEASEVDVLEKQDPKALSVSLVLLLLSGSRCSTDCKLVVLVVVVAAVVAVVVGVVAGVSSSAGGDGDDAGSLRSELTSGAITGSADMLVPALAAAICFLASISLYFPNNKCHTHIHPRHIQSRYGCTGSMAVCTLSILRAQDKGVLIW